MARVNMKRIAIGAVGVVVLIVVAILSARRYRDYKVRTQPGELHKEVPVTVRVIESETVDQEIESLANVESTRRYFLYFKASGRVAMVKKRPDGLPLMPGDLVKKGELLAQMEDEVEQAQYKIAVCQVASAEAELREAVTQADGDKRQMEFAKKRFDRYETMVKRAAVSLQDRDDAEKDLRKHETNYTTSKAHIEVARAQLNQSKAQLELSREQLKYTKLIAPIDGIVAYQNIREGDYFSNQSFVQVTDPQKLLNLCPMVLIDPDSLWAKAMLLPEEAVRLKLGGPVAILDDADDSVQLGEGEVAAIQPARNIRTRMVEVRVKITKRADRLVHGALVKCRFRVGREDVVIAPRDVLVMREGKYMAFVCDPSGVAKQQEITVGRIFPDGFEVLRGIEKGAKVAARGRYRLRDGYKIIVVKGQE
ncbi:MAG: efflux RND transporter periplasmic adaptor subunit [Planctomycetes bacterium]|nr:efflux RND transporter periplasmic adaptor subunit [Planctomycetota bacterium]